MRPLLTALLLLIFFNCIAQKNSDSLFFVNISQEPIIPNYKKETVENIPFKSIHILDARPDTSSIGFSRFTSLRIIKKLVFVNGLSNEFLKFATSNYHLDNNDSSKDLLIIIKQFRISNYAKAFNNTQPNVNSWQRGVVVSAELFMQDKNSYHALYKIDSILINDSSNSLNKLIQQGFTVLLYKVLNKNLSELHIGKTDFSFRDIEEHVNSFYAFKILQDSILKKGVYKNFNEFKSNNPSILDFELNNGKLSDEIFVHENNQSYPLQNFWGYCDGKNLFIRSAGNFFKLIRNNNTFNVRGAKSLSIRDNQMTEALLDGASNGIFGAPNRDYSYNPTFQLKLSAFQLNMENGEIY